VGVNGIISRAAMQDVGDYGFRHGGMYQNTQWIYIVRNDAGHSISY